MAPEAHKGITNTPGGRTVDETVETFKSVLKSKGITLFCVVDHSGEAARAGMTMRPTRLLIFGSPKAGTPLMLASPSVAIDLPLKLLVWEDEHGAVWMSYNDPAYLQERHGLPSALLPNISVMETLIANASLSST